MKQKIEEIIKIFGNDKRYFKSTLEKLKNDNSISKSSEKIKKRIKNKIYMFSDMYPKYIEIFNTKQSILNILEEIKQYKKENDNKITKNYINYAIENINYYVNQNFKDVQCKNPLKQKSNYYFNEEISENERNKFKFIKLEETKKYYKKYKEVSQKRVKNKIMYKGDIIQSGNDFLHCYDMKDYDKITTLMKFPANKNLKIENFQKTIDSEIIRDLSILLLNDKVKEHKEYFENILNKKAVEGEKRISKNIFETIFNFCEYGFVGLNEIKKEKTFLVKEKKKIIYKKIEMNIKEEDKITMEFVIEEKYRNYAYIYFRINGEIIYIISSRSDRKTANCAFINKSLIKKTKEVEIDEKYYKEKCFMKNKGKGFEKYVWNKLF